MKRNYKLDVILLKIILFATFFHKNLYAQRRIVEGEEIKEHKPYMVYLSMAPESPRKYDTWICGGVIIHPHYVLTSAACIEDVEKAYVVAGYDQYVKYTSFKKNRCTSKMKRKIISTAIPAAYQFSHNSVHKWSTLDIAVVEVDKPFDYTDERFKEYCSHMPNEIKVNYDERYERPNLPVMAMGWGHTKKMRRENDSSDYNVKKLRYATSLVFPKDKCKKYFSTSNLGEVIDKYMICTYEPSSLDETGPTTEELDPPVSENIAQKYISTTEKMLPPVRRGICQNDHGGPLLTWIDNEVMVLGVASTYDFNENFECQQPNLFTSTALNKDLITCVISKRRRWTDNETYIVNDTYKIIYRKLSWNDDE